MNQQLFEMFFFNNFIIGTIVCATSQCLQVDKAVTTDVW